MYVEHIERFAALYLLMGIVIGMIAVLPVAIRQSRAIRCLSDGNEWRDAMIAELRATLEKRSSEIRVEGVMPDDVEAIRREYANLAKRGRCHV